MNNEFNIWLKNAMILSRKTNGIMSLEDFDNTSELTRKIILNLYKDNPFLDKEDVFDEMNNLIKGLTRSMIDVTDFRCDVIRRNAFKALISNRNLMEKTYNDIVLEERRSGKKIKQTDNINYSSNFQKAIKQAMLEAIISVRAYVSNATKEEIETIRISTRNKENLRRLHMIMGQQKEVRDQIKDIKGLYCARNELEQVRYYLEKMNSVETIDKELKEEYISAIIHIGEGLDKYGILEKYIKQQNHEVSRLKIKELTPIKEDNAFNTLFSEEKLKKLNIYQLSALHAFWSNRLAKETVKMYKSYFIMYELNLDDFKSVHKGNLSSLINPDVFEALKLKFNAIHIKTAEIYQKCRESTREKAVVNVADKVEELEKKFGEQYNRYFSGIGGLKGLENIFSNDFQLYMLLENIDKNLYNQKDNSILALLNLLSDDERTSLNWGVIEEKKKNDYILIGADISGLNMPLRLHIKKEMLENLLQAHQGNKIIPLYDGKDDFIVNGRYIGTHVLTPFTDTQREEIKKGSLEIKEADYRNKIVQHIAFLVDTQKFPEHLQQKRITVKKGKTKIKFERIRKYIDIGTNKKYTKSKDGELIEQDERKIS